MSKLFSATGTYEDKPCHACGLVVEHERLHDLAGALDNWSIVKHVAPCGLGCFGGGAGGSTGPSALSHYKAGTMHGLTDRPCPACTGQDPVNLSALF